MDLLVMLVVGGLIGWIASWIMGTDAEMGLFANILVGVVGGLLGGWLAGVLGIGVGGPAKWLVALLGAVLLIGVVRALGLFRPRVV